MVRVSSSGISSSNCRTSSSTDIWNVFCFFPLERTTDDSFSVSLWFTHIHTFSMHFDHKSVRGQILYSQCCCSSKHPTLWTPAFYQDPCPCTTCFFFFFLFDMICLFTYCCSWLFFSLPIQLTNDQQSQYFTSKLILRDRSFPDICFKVSIQRRWKMRSS